MNKKNVIIILAICMLSIGVYAQQITRFAVIDTGLIFDTFRRDAKAARDYQEKREKFEKQKKVLEGEIVQLRQKKVNAEADGKESEVQKYEEKIKSKITLLMEYVKASNDELNMLRKNLINDDAFYSSLYESVRRVAESEGYTMVLSYEHNAGIIWYSPTVDITDKVIQELRKQSE
ncbi:MULTISPECIES: OmpH family outer membrane protein [unclassified Treponema]|uniref:OmpH family outer membrane protein n=1 Tax=unclassified Treponema TaxID=2638727 RepID=UPI0020A54A3B|nr:MULTISPECIES: OmpH family outer membrane protein [unclassified Treponema]UTC66362.1 OmpH family outer membrane protein [Treponema sp. OMZ 789]UTC69092.1 OmpH family outer membrane protein [Treponema sp. OMZ 790]UTC71804.1 OmpH family outer membrane protein [Treponema sp. OMZ 791]